MLKIIAGCILCILSGFVFAEEMFLDESGQASPVKIEGYTPPSSEPAPAPVAQPPTNPPQVLASADPQKPWPTEIAQSAEPEQPIVVKKAPVLKQKSPAKNDASIAEKWNQYFEKLRECVPGTYELTQINPFTQMQYGKIETDEIIGALNGKCHLTRRYYSDDDPRLTQPINPQKSDLPVGEDCKLTNEAIDAYITRSTIIMKTGTVIENNDDEYKKLMSKSCRTFVVVDGQHVKAG